LGGGFDGGSPDKSNVYKMGSIWGWRAFAGVLRSLGNSSGAAHFEAYADAAIAAVRNAPGPGGGPWFTSLGLDSAAQAMNGDWLSASEAAALVALRFNSLTTICSLSLFNTAFVIRALGAVGELDRGYATAIECWGVLVKLGMTTASEVSKPGWASFLDPNEPVPSFQGFTSNAHPWASGATSFIAAWLLGVRPRAPGYSEYVVAPHVAGAMEGVEGTVPLPSPPQGAASWPSPPRVRDVTDFASDVRVWARRGVVCVAAAGHGRRGVLELSAPLLARLGGGAAEDAAARVSVAPRLRNGGCACSGEVAESAGGGGEPVVLDLTPGPEAPLDAATGLRSRVASLHLAPGACTLVRLAPPADTEAEDKAGAAVAAAALAARPNPFPTPPVWPAYFVGRDEATQGSWIGTYGTAGHWLVAMDNNASFVTQLPPWLSSAHFARGDDGAAKQTWPSADTAQDPRALQDPRGNSTGARKLGGFVGSYGGEDIGSNSGDPSMPFDIVVSAPAPANSTYQFAFYFCDFDRLGRRSVAQLIDLETLEDVSPLQVLRGDGLERGTWLVWQYPRSVRLRSSWIRGLNQVALNAALFDLVQLG
jgi:hypothetical protein